jgi:hypothetical protein
MMYPYARRKTEGEPTHVQLMCACVSIEIEAAYPLAYLMVIYFCDLTFIRTTVQYIPDRIIIVVHVHILEVSMFPRGESAPSIRCLKWDYYKCFLVVNTNENIRQSLFMGAFRDCLFFFSHWNLLELPPKSSHPEFGDKKKTRSNYI